MFLRFGNLGRPSPKLPEASAKGIRLDWATLYIYIYIKAAKISGWA